MKRTLSMLLCLCLCLASGCAPAAEPAPARKEADLSPHRRRRAGAGPVSSLALHSPALAAVRPHCLDRTQRPGSPLSAQLPPHLYRLDPLR